MKLLNILNKTIEYSFYLLFFLVPLALTGDTSELFEFNKLWVTFILTIVILYYFGKSKIAFYVTVWHYAIYVILLLYFVNKYSAHTPMKRLMTLDEVPPVFDFLLNEKSTYVTGAEFYVDGGWTAW